MANEISCNDVEIRAGRSLSAADVPQESRDFPSVSMSETAQTIKFTAPHGGKRPGAGRKPKPAFTPIPDVFPYWCVVQTHPSAERLATHEMTRAGYRAYLPLAASMKRDAVVKTMFHRVVEPHFRGYVFLELTDPCWSPVRYLSGVVTPLLGHNGNPHRVPTALIDKLFASDNERLAITTKIVPMTAIPVGSRVSINDGAFTDNTGMVLECDGITTMVSLELFGRSMAVQMVRTQLAIFP